MRIPRTLPRPLRAGWALCACLLVIIAAQSQALARQSCDTCPPADTQQNSWRANTRVTVNINPYMTQEQRNAVQAAFDNWQFSPSNTTGVTFVYTYSSTPVGSGGVQVNLQTPSISGAQAETFRFPTSDGSSLDRAVMNIDPRVTNLTAMTQATAHEIGHTMGIDDCDTCCPGVSVMTGYSGDYNDTTSGREGPGSCDAVTANGTLGTPLTPDYGGGGGGDIGGGGGGGGYYCTPYYWVYYESWDGGRTWEVVDMSYAGCW